MKQDLTIENKVRVARTFKAFPKVNIKREEAIIRKLILFFIIVLFLSGVTAIPIDIELSALLKIIPADNPIYTWLEKVLFAYRDVNSGYPFLLYGYDWLAFAHFVLAILFIGPYKDPVKNIWILQFGLISCVLIFPLAFIAGTLREIPIGWILIDCSFGVFGFIPLYICFKKTQLLEKYTV